MRGDAGADTLSGDDGNDELSGGAGDDTLSGGVGNDRLSGDAGDDTLLGGDGTDYLSGAEGNDVLEGGAGNDSLSGGGGSDLFLFGRGSGQDTVSSYDTTAGKVDAIEFAAGIASTDVQATRLGNNLVLSLAGTTDKLTVSSYFDSDATSAYKLEEIRFADGTVWTIDAVKAMVQQNTSGDDSLYGYAGDDTLSGGDGNDSLRGDAGNDMLSGGNGNDSLHGDAGADALSGDDGNDELSGGAGDDTLSGGVGNDRLSGDAGADTLMGGDGADYLSGAEGNDVLEGGAGNDSLSGGDGSDLFLFGRGSGQDTVSSYDTTAGKVDAIQFAAGIASTDVQATRLGNNLVLSLAGTTDRLTVSMYFYSDATGAYKLEEIRFADGTVWTIDAVKALVQQNTSGDDSLYGYAGADTLSGGDGNDSLSGGAGDDTLSGGDGTDYLNGGDGTDVLMGEEGDDSLYGDAGNDILRGDTGNDRLYDVSGAGLFDGGSGNDTLSGGAGVEIFVGGNGNDTYVTGAGNDIILFNKGDGQDTFVSTGTGGDILSLGGDFSYADLSFSKSGNHLLLHVGESDQIKFSDWYATTPSRPVALLQVIAEGMPGFERGGDDPIGDQTVECFDFTSLVSAFDAARAADASLNAWALGNALSDALLGGSDAAAYGGDVAYQYGIHGGNGVAELVGSARVFTLLSDANLGIQIQDLTGSGALT